MVPKLKARPLSLGDRDPGILLKTLERWSAKTTIRLLRVEQKSECYTGCETISRDILAMPSLPMLAARCPTDWVDQVNEIARLTGRTSAEVVREAIGQYLGMTDLREMQGAISSLERRVSQLERNQKVTIHEN